MFYTKRAINERCFMTENERAVLEAIQHIQNCQGEETYISDSFIRGTVALSKNSVTNGKLGLKKLGVLREVRRSKRAGTRYQINRKRLNKIVDELNEMKVTSERLIRGNEVRKECGLKPLNNSDIINCVKQFKK